MQDGSLWTAGVGKVGQLGTGARTTEDSWDDDELLWWPKQVTTFQEFDEFIGNCSASTYFTMALTTTGRAYSFGAGFQGKLFSLFDFALCFANINLVLQGSLDWELDRFR